MILEMDWLFKYYATLKGREKIVQFFIPRVPGFYFRGDRWDISAYFVSYLQASQMLRKGYTTHLAYVNKANE